MKEALKTKDCCADVSSCCSDGKSTFRTEDEIRNMVRDRYAGVASRESSCCGSTGKSRDISEKLGYSQEEMDIVPEGSNLGLGCGNPTAVASLKEGETVLDLGSGAGFDCFLAANKIGADGRVIGVDMTPEMLGKARGNARKGNYENVEFRLGEIENLPVADNFVDVIISNCVINLAPDKERVFKEAFRVTKPGGRLMISDMVLLKELPDAVKNSDRAYACCIAGAVMKEEYLSYIEEAGFEEIRIISDTTFSLDSISDDPAIEEAASELGMSCDELADASELVASIQVFANKPVN